MKSIELTKEHKSKLLEMCKELFPEFNEWRFGKVTAEGNLEDFYNKTKNLPWQDREKYEQSCDFLWIEKDFKYEHDDNIERSETWVIHWFEFCMTHLVEKLNDLSDVYEEIPPYVANVYGGANGKWNLYVKFHFHYPKNRYKKHPIDYLYEEFKKLK